MKNIKRFESFFDDVASSELYDDMESLLIKANVLICNHKGIDPVENNIVVDIDSAIDGLSEIDTEESNNLIGEINSKDDEIYSLEDSEFENSDIDEKEFESVGDLEPNFINIDIDETELKDSEKPKNGKLNQKEGSIIIENPSKTDEYNAKMRLGGEVIVDKKFPEKSIHHVKKFNDFH